MICDYSKATLKRPLKRTTWRKRRRKEGRKESSLPSEKCVLPQAEVPELPYVLNTSDDIEALALHPGRAAGQELECLNVCMCTRYYLHKTFLYV